MSLAAARSHIEQLLWRSVDTEVVPLWGALHRVLSSDMRAPLDLPQQDIATRDGYAIRSSDLDAKKVAHFRVIGAAAAGHPLVPLPAPGEAVRIFTGAPMPPGLDTVIMQEACEVADGILRVPARGLSRHHVKARGQDFTAGQLILRHGDRLRSHDLGLAASLGLGDLPVYRQLRVALFSTGDELIEPGCPLAPGKAWDANRAMLRAMLIELGCVVSDCGIVLDNLPRSIGDLAGAAQDHDLIITSGGMSVGDADHIREAIRRRGSLEIWQLAMKPGRPVGFGDIDDCPILALPGNPIAALTAFMLLGTMIVARLSGSAEDLPGAITLPGDVLLTKPLGERHFQLGRLIHQYGLSFVESADFGETRALFPHLIEADGLIDFAEDLAVVRPGDPVRFIPFRQPSR